MGLIEQFSASVNTVIDSQLRESGSLNLSPSHFASVYKWYVIAAYTFLEKFCSVIHLPARMANKNVKKLKAIIERASKSNINIQRLSAVGNHLTPSDLSLSRLFLLIPIAFGAVAFIYGKSWINDGKKCLISLPDSLSHAFRPPEDCGFCRNISQADRVSNISPKDFEQNYAYNAKPVVITDATINWTALDVFDFWYFKDVYESPLFDSEQMNCQFFPVNGL